MRSNAFIFSLLSVAVLNNLARGKTDTCDHPKYMQEIIELFVDAGIDNCHVDFLVYLIDRPKIRLVPKKSSENSTESSWKSDHYRYWDYDDPKLAKYKDSDYELNFLSHDPDEDNWVKIPHDMYLETG